jgi:hypothetical protein
MFHNDVFVVLLTLLGLLGAYAFVVRPRLIRWGATVEEAMGPYPGAGLIPRGVRSGTMAVTIEASPASVWAWLVQMGYDRAGWYSWDRLDNWGRHSAEQIHPEWQQLTIGDHVSAMPDNSIWWEVAALDLHRFLGLRASVDLRGRPFNPRGTRPSSYSDSLWGFQLKELPGGDTRLVVSGYWIMQPRWLQPIVNLFLEPAHWVMQVRQFANLKRRAERDSKPMAQAA